MELTKVSVIPKMSMVEQINLELLNKKIDHMIDLFEKTMAILERRKTKKVEEKTTNWSIQEYKNSILVRFSFNLAFKNFVKELGGKWMVAKKAWMFPKSNTTFVQEIKDKFPDWDFKEITENESASTTDADEVEVEID